MNSAALLMILIAALGKASTSDLDAAKDFVGTKTCQANDGKCVGKVVIEGVAVVKALKKARKVTKDSE
jgi:hypothetical protein